MNLNKNYFTISDVSKITQVPKYKLRYWEKLNLIKPIRLDSKHRRYTKLDIENIEKIKNLINNGFSINGIKKVINSKPVKNKEDFENSNYKRLLSIINRELKEIIKIID